MKARMENLMMVLLILGLNKVQGTTPLSKSKSSLSFSFGEGVQRTDEVKERTGVRLFGLQQLHIELLQKEKQWNELDSRQLERVIDIANNLNIATGQAQAILGNYFGYSFDLLRPQLPEKRDAQQRKAQPQSNIQYLNGEKEIELFPNPASDRITIALKYAFEYNVLVKVFDVSGKEVMTERIPQGSDYHEMNISVLSTGLYIAKFYNGQSQLSENKFIVNQKQ